MTIHYLTSQSARAEALFTGVVYTNNNYSDQTSQRSMKYLEQRVNMYEIKNIIEITVTLLDHSFVLLAKVQFQPATLRPSWWSVIAQLEPMALGRKQI